MMYGVEQLSFAAMPNFIYKFRTHNFKTRFPKRSQYGHRITWRSHATLYLNNMQRIGVAKQTKHRNCPKRHCLIFARIINAINQRGKWRNHAWLSRGRQLEPITDRRWTNQPPATTKASEKIKQGIKAPHVWSRRYISRVSCVFARDRGSGIVIRIKIFQ